MSTTAPPPSLRQQHRRATNSLRCIAVAAGVSALLGVVVLLGWALDAPALRSVFRGAVQMKANTAVGLIAAAAALWLAAVPGPALRQRLARALALFVMALGTATLSEYVFGWQLGIDELLVRDTANAFNFAKGRMSPFSALAFAALGLALTTLPHRPAGVIVRTLAGFVLLVGCVSFLGYLWDASELVSDRWVPPVAVNTAWGFILLGGGTLLASTRLHGAPERPQLTRDSIEAKMLGGFLLAMLVEVIGGGYTYKSSAEFAVSAAAVAHSLEVRAQLGRLSAALAAVEAAQSNDVLPGQPASESAFAGHAQATRELVQTLGRMLAGNPSQTVLFQRLHLLIDDRIGQLQALRGALHAGGETAARSAVEAGVGSRGLDAIRGLAGRIDTAESDLLAQRRVTAESQRRTTLFSLLLTLASTSALFALLFRSIRREMLARNAVEEAIQRLNNTLEQRVCERTAELSYERSFLRKVIDLNRSFIFAKDREGRFVLANDAVAEAYGTTVDDLLGKSDQDFNPNLDEVRHFQATDLAVIDSGREVVVDEEKITDAAGRVRWLQTVKRPMLMPDGVATMLLGVSADITQRKADEESLRLATHTAEQANRAKSEFLANMSHEIRTPMNGVIGLSHLLAQTPLNAEQSGLIAKIMLANKSLLGVLNNVLDVSKIEAGELIVEDAVFSLPDLLDELTSVIAVQAQAKQIRFDIDAPGDLPQAVQGDATRLSQILTNLLSNAIKFTEHGSVRLQIRQLATTPLRTTLCFVVQDTGIGIAPEAQERLFAPFAQADASITRRFGGTGLGLSIVKRLTRLMGGVLELESTPGAGSAFKVELTFGVAAPGVGAVPLPSAAVPGKHALRGARVLVVDDSDINLNVTKGILELEGAEVVLARNGQEAVDFLQVRPAGVDVVLMDVQMPELDGHEATRRIRMGLGLQDLPIIALTASALSSERQRATAAGMDDYIIKPFDARSLIAAILRRVPACGDRPAPTTGAAQPGRMAPAPPWPEIEGIDAGDVRARLGDDFDLFRSMLQRLLDEFADVSIAADAGDPLRLAEHSRLLHKLKGSAGIIGAKAIHQLASRAEAACTAGEATVAVRLCARLATDLRWLRQVAAPALAAGAAPELGDASPVSAGVEPDAERFAELIDLLRRQSMSALDRFKALSPQLRSCLGDDAHRRVQGHIENLRFADAAAALQPARQHAVRGTVPQVTAEAVTPA